MVIIIVTTTTITTTTVPQLVKKFRFIGVDNATVDQGGDLVELLSWTKAAFWSETGLSIVTFCHVFQRLCSNNNFFVCQGEDLT